MVVGIGDEGVGGEGIGIFSYFHKSAKELFNVELCLNS